jgi:shikimate kinase
LDRLDNLDRRGVVCLPGQTVEHLYTERRPLYRRYAHTTIHCAGRTPDQLVGDLLAALERDPLFQPG